jgi:hypothetical protein
MSSHAEITDLGGGYAVSWPEQNVQMLVEYLAQERNGLIGEVTIRDGGSVLCESLRVNLNAEPKTKSIAKKVHECDGRISLPEWARLIESTCVLVLRHYRTGEPSVYINSQSQVEPLTYAVNPLVIKKKPNVLFADGGKGKSTMTLLCCMLVNSGKSIAGFSALKGRALYIDFEDDVDVHVRRLHAIQAGHPELKDAGVEYLRCTQPIWKQPYRLAKLIQEMGITFMVVDSLLLAMGGEATSEAAGKYFAALRQFNVESLSIGHVRKSIGEDERVTIYGSVFNHNLARNIWQLKTEQETGEDTAILGLFHEKHNLTRKHPPIGLRVTYNQDGSYIRYEPHDLNQTAEIEKALPLPNRIRNLLDSDGIPRCSKDIAEALSVKLNIVQATLSRQKGRKWSMIGENREALWTTLRDS